MKKRSGFTVMARLIGLVKPLSGYMVLAILMGLVGHLCAAFITIFGGFAVLDLLGFATPVALKTTFVCVLLFALVRGIFRYAEQSCNHFIAFKLLALIRDKVFRALRRLCPAKLEGRDRGDLISVITSDIELLEVFYAHTISPAAIAALFTLIMCLFIGHYHALLGLLALAAYVCVGVVIPLITSRRSGDTGMRFRTESGALSAFVLDSLRGLNETIQYDRGAERRAEMDARTDALSKEEAKLKRLTGQNMGITNTAILLFDLAMLVSSAVLVQRGDADVRRGAHRGPCAVLVIWSHGRAGKSRLRRCKTPSPRATACSIFWMKRPSSTRSPASRKSSSPARRPSTSRFPTAGRTFSPTFPSASRRGASSASWAAAAAESRRS